MCFKKDRGGCQVWKCQKDPGISDKVKGQLSANSCIYARFYRYINKVSKIMNESNAKSLFDNTAMLYKQTESSSRHDVCLDQRSFKCKIGENCNNILSI